MLLTTKEANSTSIQVRKIIYIKFISTFHLCMNKILNF